MGDSASKLWGHQSPIDKKGRITTFSRLPEQITKKFKKQSLLHHHEQQQSLQTGEQGDKAIVPFSDVTPQQTGNAQTLGTVLGTTFLEILAIVSALALQNFLTSAFETMMPTATTTFKIIALLLQFLLVFSFLIFFTFLFAG